MLGAELENTFGVVRILFVSGNVLTQKQSASHYLRIVGVEVLLELMAGARGDFVNTWTSRFYLINYFVPVLYLAKSDMHLLAGNTGH